MVSYGVVTRNPSEVTWPVFDRAYFEVKDVTGRRTDPVAEAVNMVSCFGDNDAAEADPSIVPVTADGDRATRDQPYFDWAYVCPTEPSYRERVLDLVEDCAKTHPDVRLDDVGFPRQGYCRCARCDRLFAESDHDERDAWRAEVITAFVREATDRIPGRTALTVYPDPYPGHLYRRSGVDLATLTSIVDEVVVPLYDMAYTTTYWLEVIASGFRDAVDTRLSVELYAVNVDPEALVTAGRVVGAYAESVLFAYDGDTARTAIQALRHESDMTTASDG